MYWKSKQDLIIFKLYVFVDTFESIVLICLQNVTIADLIRCPDYKVWNPNEFCTQSGFESIFNLGLDVIFQNNGKLWRYLSEGANNYGNPYLQNKLQSIRFVLFNNNWM